MCVLIFYIYYHYFNNIYKIFLQNIYMYAYVYIFREIISRQKDFEK